MQFKYFEAPESEMKGLREGELTCSICGNTGRCFDLGSADSDSLATPELKQGVGCVSCLKAGSFEFLHTTEIGFVTSTGLVNLDDDPEQEEVVVVSPSGEVVEIGSAQPSLRPTVNQGSVQELRRTPGFSTWNEVEWPVHCGDFMVFLGPWEPAEFNANAEGGRGRELFLRIVDRSDHDLWPDDEQPQWHVTCFVFRCLRCSIFQAIVDYS